MPENDNVVEELPIPVMKIAIITAVATPVVALVTSKRLRKRALDALFGPEEDFSYTVPESQE
jgi:hypothetical protein